MRRFKPVLIGMLIIIDLAILLGIPFLETMGEVPRRLESTLSNVGTDPAAAALPVGRLFLGAVVLATILDQIWAFSRLPTLPTGPTAPTSPNGPPDQIGQVQPPGPFDRTGPFGPVRSIRSTRTTKSPRPTRPRSTTPAGPEILAVPVVTTPARRPPARPAGWTDVRIPERSENLLPASMAVRDRWHDLPAWTWVGPEGAREVQIGNTTWPVDRFSVTVESGIDFDEALRRFAVQDALRQLAETPLDFDRRRAVVVALSFGQHWPFLGRSSFVLSTARITATGESLLDGVFVVRSHDGADGVPVTPPSLLTYLVTPTTAATRLLENDPDLVVALAEHLDPPTPEHRDGQDLQQRLSTAIARLPREPSEVHERRSSPPPGQESVFRIQKADSFQGSRANTKDRRNIVSIARIDRGHPPTQSAQSAQSSPFAQPLPGIAATGALIGADFEPIAVEVQTRSRPSERPPGDTPRAG